VGFLLNRHAKKTQDPHRFLDAPHGPRPDGYRPGEGVPGTVAVYFADDPRKLYQLRQWMPVFERLNEHHPLVLVTRHPKTYAELAGSTRLRRVLVPAFPDLADLYERSDFKVAVYVNNSVHNFHSLRQSRMLHVHVNHGESDKVCMVSNQVKAYDQVFVAGEAATRRHRAALIGFDEDKLVPVGRPQLDLSPEPVLAPSARRTILYAPTWEGENASNNYTSVDVSGPAIMAAALAVPDTRVVYKPHPRAAISPLPSMAAAHQQIVGLLESAAQRQPAAGHRFLPVGDILAVFEGCDLMITDVSSVGLDFLYRRVDRPMFIADRYDNPDRLRADAPISRCADVIDSTTIAGLTARLAERLVTDPYRADREDMRRFYFGDLAPGESTQRFIAAIGDTVATRDRQLGRLDAGLAVLHTETTGRSA
jgi:CDP-glycerol glycerophosphotransferase (TagB/SpsB family)